MNQTHLLIETLRRYLKFKGIKYRDLALKMGQTEANIKRIFSQKTLSLAQLEKMCVSVGTDLFELVKMSAPNQSEPGIFTEMQEKVLAEDSKLFTFFYLLLSSATLEYIQKNYVFSKTDCEKFLLKLDKIGLIRLQESNKFQILVSKNIRWLEGGPLNDCYYQQIKSEFMDSTFTGANERLRFLNAPLSRESFQLLTRRIDKLIAEFSEMAEMDRHGPSSERVPLWLVVAHRPWNFSQVKSYRKQRK